MAGQVTGPAWQIRSSQRQNLLDDLMRKTWDEYEEHLEDIRDNPENWKWEFFNMLIQEVMWFMRFPNTETLWRRAKATLFLKRVVLPAVENFAVDSIERNALLAMYLEKHLMPTLANDYTSALHRAEFQRPSLYFGAPGATDEITVDIDD